jgi:tRNA (guanine9-N1)-methyltransferase
VGLTVDHVQSQGLSRKELKRRLRQKKWNDEKEERRKIQREKRKRRRKSMKEKGIKPASMGRVVIPMKESPNTMIVAIDLSFQEYMNEKETRKLRKQLQRVYSVNRRFPTPLQLHLTSVAGDVRAKLVELMPGFEKWDLHCHEEHYLEVFKEFREKKAIVYLSCDSPNVAPENIQTTAGQLVYIIGGLVDHNVYKGLTLGLAQKHGIEHVKLPLDEYIKMSFGRVLTVNHVFEIMLEASVGASWGDAFFKIIPQRKIKEDGSSSSSSSSSDGD